jgi:hypothetical protein
MPTFHVWPVGQSDCDSFWIYAVDELDARDQIASTLRIASLDETLFGAGEVTRFIMPLNKILHSSGEWTQVPLPEEAACDADAIAGGNAAF